MTDDTPEKVCYASVTEYFDDSVKKDWREWLALGDSLDLDKRCSLMWIWPTENELQKLGTLLKANEISHVLSVGCGNGLLEWIVQKSLGISVYGIEIDRAWWESKYVVKSFISLNYIEDLKQATDTPDDYLKKCCNLQNWDFALLFCYFNNRTAFLNYLNMYKGNSLLIIGPNIGTGVYTDPLPLEPHFPDASNWKLNATLRIGKTDVLAFYVR